MTTAKKTTPAKKATPAKKPAAKQPTVAELVKRIEDLEAKNKQMGEEMTLHQARFMQMMGAMFTQQGQAVVDRLYPPTFELQLVDDKTIEENAQSIRVMREADGSFFVFAKSDDTQQWVPLEPESYSGLDLEAAFTANNCESEKPYRFNVIRGNTHV